MNTSQTMRMDAQTIIQDALSAVLPDESVRRVLSSQTFSGRVILIAVGKAAWQMANAAYKCMGEQISAGLVLTKYGHVKGPIGNFTCHEGGHPIPDAQSFIGTQMALKMVSGLSKEDTVLFLLSGGGSALFEQTSLSEEELRDITTQLLACGADINEINTIRKHLSAVKGGRFAQACLPARVLSIILSDVLGDSIDMIASGPASPDLTTCEQAESIVRKYGLTLTDQAKFLLRQETPKVLNNVESHVVGSVHELCMAAGQSCARLGYKPVILTDRMCCQAKEAGSILSSMVCSHANDKESLALIAGGETVVQLTGDGKGGRNQELALAAAEGIRGLDNVLFFSLGSDGTDGPTEAAGGIVDGRTADVLERKGLSIYDVLSRNDAYSALEEVDGLIMTGPTGTNVNDVAVGLIRISCTLT